MSNLGESLYIKGYVEGFWESYPKTYKAYSEIFPCSFEEYIEQGKILLIRSVMEEIHCRVETAMAYADIPEADWEKYSKILAEQ